MLVSRDINDVSREFINASIYVVERDTYSARLARCGHC